MGIAGALFAYRQIKQKMLDVLDEGLDPHGTPGSKGWMGTIRTHVSRI
jgi:hypothetical protein